MTARPGFALVVVLMVVAILGIAAAGMLAVGARESEIARAMARRSAARLAAESAAGWALAGWSTRRYRALAPGEASGAVALPAGPWPNESPAVAASFSVTRLGTALYLVHGTGQHPDLGPPSADRAGLLVRTVDPELLAAGFPAAVSAENDARVDAGIVDGDRPCAQADMGPGATAVGAPGVLAPAVTISAAATVSGTPSVLFAQPPMLPMPELLAPPLLEALATVAVTVDAVTPRPHTGPDGCMAGAGNWGAVSATNPCYHHLPLVRAAGDLTVRGGEGRGLLVVDGDLAMEDVRFDGAILVRGNLTISQGTAVRGAIRAATVWIDDGSVTHDQCDLIAALTAGGLDRPFRPAHRLWVPVF